MSASQTNPLILKLALSFTLATLFLTAELGARPTQDSNYQKIYETIRVLLAEGFECRATVYHAALTPQNPQTSRRFYLFPGVEYCFIATHEDTDSPEKYTITVKEGELQTKELLRSERAQILYIRVNKAAAYTITVSSEAPGTMSLTYGFR